MPMHHVKSGMPTGWIRPFLAVYTEVPILEVAQGFGLAHG